MSEYASLREDVFMLDKRMALLEQQMDQINQKLERLTNILGQFAKVTGVAFFGGLISAFVAWVIKGGLAQ